MTSFPAVESRRSGSAMGDVCIAALPALRADGASARWHVTTGSASTYSSDGTAAQLDRAEQSAGEGPATSAHACGRPVLVGDLRSRRARQRWPGLTEALGSVEVGRCVALPLTVHGSALGVLALYSRRRGRLSRSQWGLARAAADAATVALLVGLGEMTPLLDYRCYQATGMVMAQTGLDASWSLSLLRARAFREGAQLDQLTTEVIARRVSFATED